MIGLIVILAIAYACARGIENGMTDVSKQHKQRIKKAAKKNGRRTGAKLAAWTATAGTAAGTFWRGFKRGWRREWPKAKKRAATKFGRYTPDPNAAASAGPNGAPAPATRPTPTAPPVPGHAPAGPAPATPPTGGRTLVLIKDDPAKTTPDTSDTSTGDTMALANIPEITGVNTLKAAVARTASESGVTAEEASAIAQRAQDEMATIESMIEQASALEFGDDGGTLQELAAMRDMAAAALVAAQNLQKAMVDKAAVAAQSSKNIHDRHGNIQEAIDAQGGRMASKQAYTADV